jgi:hypothetical protein
LSGITVANNGLEYDYYHFANEHITIAHRTGISSAGGKNLYSSNQDVRCRIEYTPHMVRNAAGERVVSNAMISLMQVINIEDSDQLTLPSGSQPVIIAIEQDSNEYGPYRQVIHV